MHHSPCLPGIQTPFLQAFLHGINPAFPGPNHCATINTLPYINLLSNPVILYSLHVAEPSENTFIKFFFHTLRYSTELSYPYIRDFIHSPDTQQTSEVVHPLNPNPRPLLILTSNDSCKTVAHSNCKLLVLTRDLTATATLLPLSTFPLQSSSFELDSSETHPKYLNSETCSKHIHLRKPHTLGPPPHLKTLPCSYLH